MSHWQTITVSTTARQQLIDITPELERLVRESGADEGQVTVYVRHTTAGVTINEGADPAVQADIIMALDRMVDDGWPFRHAEGNSPAHVKTSLIGSSVVVPVSEGRLGLGTWQRVFFCEFDGPRTRRALIRMTADQT